MTQELPMTAWLAELDVKSLTELLFRRRESPKPGGGWDTSARSRKAHHQPPRSSDPLPHSGIAGLCGRQPSAPW